MRRHLLTAASVVSLLVCVGAAAMRFVPWPPGGVALRQLDRYGSRRNWDCWVDRRGLMIIFFRPEVPQRVVGHYDNQTNRATGFNYRQLAADAHTTKLQFWEFEIGRNVPLCNIGMDDIMLQGFATEVAVPWWMVCAAAAPLPLWRVLTMRRRTRRRRRERGLCAGCGYDLRGNVSGVCPECGEAARATVRAPQ
jgi:hypothetical protein